MALSLILRLRFHFEYLLSRQDSGSVWERSLTESTLSTAEGFEMTNRLIAVIPSASEESFARRRFAATEMNPSYCSA